MARLSSCSYDKQTHSFVLKDFSLYNGSGPSQLFEVLGGNRCCRSDWVVFAGFSSFANQQIAVRNMTLYLVELSFFSHCLFSIHSMVYMYFFTNLLYNIIWCIKRQNSIGHDEAQSRK